MKVTALSLNQLIGDKIPAATARPEVSFKQMFQAISSSPSAGGLSLEDSLLNLGKLRGLLESKQTVSAKDLLIYQVRLHELNLRVELLSKAADSALAVSRRLQNPQ